MEISTVFLFIKQVLATFMTLLMMISPSFGGNGVPYEAENPDELIMSFVAVSDIHVETNNPDSYKNFSDVLEGIKAGEDHDAVFYLGDNVMNGQLLENFFFYAGLRAVMPAKNNFVVAGNHDFGNGAGDYPSLRKNYLFNNTFYLCNKLENDYYYRVINGCYMIVLVSEDPTTGEFMMSEEQFTWLEGVLKEAKAKDAPIFVFNHFPLHYLKGTEYNRLALLLAEYDTALFIHGHIHNDLGTDNFGNWYGVNTINLPRITETVEYEAGDGIVVEVYDNEVLVRGRDFIKGEWIDELIYRYPLG
ncbi:MAG: metallophosphoesterase [Clostridia bacterium]|nr:metallophosphoesterase [Clostridia bacterium]